MLYDELQPLLIQDSAPQERRLLKLKDVVEITKALPDGMARTYATFGPIAILYSPGFWLIAPVLTGGLISVSEKAFEMMAKRYPENELVKRIARISKGTNEIVIGYFEDYGFTYSLITTIAAQIGGVKYYSNFFAKVTAPITSFIPALLVRYARFRHANNQENGLPLEMFAGTMQGANSPTLITESLQLQGVISETSLIPSIIIIISGITGLLSGMTQESRPRLSLILRSIIEGIADLSLASALLDFPNDIYAAANNDEIPDAFFYTTLVIALLYALGAISYRGYDTRQKYQILSAQEPLDYVADIEAGSGQDSDEDSFSDSDEDNEASDDGEPEEANSDHPPVLVQGSQPNNSSNHQVSFFHSSSSEGSDNEDSQLIAPPPASSPNHQNEFFKRSPSIESFFGMKKPEKLSHHRTSSLT